MTSRVTLYTLIALCLALGVPHSNAQDKKGPVLVGKVFLESSSGNETPLGRAKVELKDSKDKVITRAFSSSKGVYAIFADIKKGTYKVVVSFDELEKNAEFEYKGERKRIDVTLESKKKKK